MKGKLLQAVEISHNKILEKGTEIDVITSGYGCCGNYYVCELPNHRQVYIETSKLVITDWHPYIDWEKRRWDAAVAAMQGILSDPEINSDGKTVAKASLEYADALVSEFKKGGKF